MNFAEISAGYTPRETSFSSLLAKENIHVTFNPRATSASFNIETRALTLPVYKKDVPSFLVDTLIYHEVAHALYSHIDDWKRLVKKYGQSVTNIFEDVVIEHAIKLDYPGAARIMPKGHLWKYDNLFDEDLDSENFLTRFIAHFKTAGSLPVSFSDSERGFNRKIKSMVDAGATTEELLVEWKEFDEQEKEKERQEQEQNEDEGEPEPEGDEDEGEPEPVPGEESDEEENEPEVTETSPDEGEEPEADEDEGEPETSEESNEDEGSEKSDSGESEESDEDEEGDDPEMSGPTESGEDENEDDEDEESAGSDGPAESDDDEVEENSEDDSEDDEPGENFSHDNEEKVKEPDESELFSDVGTTQNVVTITGGAIEALVHNTSYDMAEYWNTIYAPTRTSGNMSSAAAKRMNEFDQETTAAAREMFAQFNQLADARSLDNQSEYDSGEIDVDLLTEYRTRDDLFSQEVFTEGGVDHGFFNLIDFSWSMMPNRSGSKKRYQETQFFAVMRQVTVMAKFCQMASLPYRCYAFTSARRRPDDWEPKSVENGVTSRFGLGCFFHDSMSGPEYQEALDRVMYLGANGYKGRASVILDRLASGTPLAESIMAIPGLTAGMDCEKLSVVILTDGQAGTMCLNTNRHFTNYRFIAPMFSSKTYDNSVSGVAQFVNDILPNAHMTYYFVQTLIFAGKQEFYDSRYNLQKEGKAVKDLGEKFTVDVKYQSIMQIDASPYMGFDAIFFVNPSTGYGRFMTDDEGEESEVTAKLSQSDALAEFKSNNRRSLMEKQFAADFIRNVA